LVQPSDLRGALGTSHRDRAPGRRRDGPLPAETSGRHARSLNWCRGALTSPGLVRSVPSMSSNAEMRIEPAAEILSATRGWLDPIRTALGPEFLSAYLTGRVLT